MLCSVVPLDHMGAEIKEDARETRCVAIPASGAPVWDEVLPLCTRVDLSEVAGFRVKLKNLESRWKKSDRLGIVDVSLADLELTADANLGAAARPLRTHCSRCRAASTPLSFFAHPPQAASWTAGTRWRRRRSARAKKLA